ncbi:MAG: glucokinase [Syntrophales bacterium]|jgi:glucokinase|nr:glucokinase [Syntrophales bacterium]
MFLVGDIGGTKTRLAVFPSAMDKPVPLKEAVFASSHYAGLEEVVRAFLTPAADVVEAAVFGVAGPVVDGRVKLTNLPWALDENHLKETLALNEVYLLNDILATAAAIPDLPREALLTLQRGQGDNNGNVAVIAPGTGLGEAFMTHRDGRWRAHATEGGHADFAPRDDGELALWRRYRKEGGRVSVERLCAGPGIARIYGYLLEADRGGMDPGDSQGSDDARDPVPGIVAAALRETDPCPLCVKTMRLYVTLLGAEAGNLALKVMATGGVYLGGGIPPRIAPFLQDEPFLRAFRDKGRMSGLMERMPVHVILEPRAALLGAASWFLREKGAPT